MAKTSVPTIDEMLADLRGHSVPREALLAELDALLRTKPSSAQLGNNTDEVLEWLGRAKAALRHWDRAESTALMTVETKVHSVHARDVEEGYRRLLALLHQARASIRLEVAPGSVAIESGKVFEYFDELRKIIGGAAIELFFVDPYLDADFVSRYLPFASKGVKLRLLAGDKKLSTLLPAVDLFAKENGAAIPVRATNQIHDRYVFVDGKECYQSGASFKDGAAKTPTTITQIRDAFAAMLATYEAIWNSAKVER